MPTKITRANGSSRVENSNAARRLITRYQFQYPGRKEIQLVFFSVVEYRGEPDYGMFAEVRWVPVEQMPSFEFLEGDVEFVRALATGGFDLSGPSGN